MELRDIGNRFLNHEPIPTVAFEHNDPVEIVAGEYKGKFGSLVTIVAMNPEVTYVVELGGTGLDVEVAQSQLKRADT